jgi:hypothetical protein
MRKLNVFACMLLLLTSTIFAQVGIGNTDPAASSALDITATNKGLLVPRVALTGSTDTATITLPATSLLVYNTATEGTSPNNVTPGYYYYTGTQWERLTNSGANSIGVFTSATANGATITGGVLQLAPANGTNGGVVTTAAQTFAGTKTFNVDAIVNGLTVGKGPGNGTNNVSNTAIGIEALSSITDWTPYPANYNMANTGAIDNVAVGYQVLKRTTNGTANTGVGKEALAYNTTGNANTALGMIALMSNTTGSLNTAVGKSSMFNNLTGIENTAVGVTSLDANTSGGYNTAIGLSALLKTTTGSYNTALGNSAGSNITTGSNNVAIGYLSGLPQANATISNSTAIGTTAVVSASNSTAIGYQAIANGSNSTAIGSGAIANGNNSTAIGSGATVNAANTIQLGNSAVIDIYGGNTATGFGANFRGKAFIVNSDARIKKDIVNSKYGLATILKLRPVDYHLINDVKQEPQVGFIAQEVKAVVPELVTGKEGDLAKGEILGVNYAGLAPILTKAIQELKKENELQQIEINQLKELVKNLINKK